MIGNLNMKTKMFDFEERVLIGLTTEYCERASQSRRVQHFCFYVKVVYHFRPQYRWVPLSFKWSFIEPVPSFSASIAFGLLFYTCLSPFIPIYLDLSFKLKSYLAEFQMIKNLRYN